MVTEKKDNSKRILIIDDEMFIREIYRDAFEMSGFVVEEAVDGVAGIEKLNSGSFDIIILDIMMPNMDGVTMLATITEEKPKFPLGAIMIATNLEPDSLDSLQKLYSKYGGDPSNLNVVEHLVKANIEPEELVRKVNMIVAN